MTERRVKYLDIEPEFLFDIIKQSDGQFGVTVEGIPADARVVACATQRSYDVGLETIRLFIESKEFPDQRGNHDRLPPLGVLFRVDREKQEICKKCPHNTRKG